MKIHEFATGNKPVMVLIHGVLTPWKVWMPQIEHFKSNYDVYAIALSAHTEEYASEFTDMDTEADNIIKSLEDKGLSNVDVLCGISFGGKIAHRIWQDGRIGIKKLVMDGAPLVSCPKFMQNIMIKNYIKIIHQSKARNPKVIASFKKNFLPERYLDDYLKIADFMTDESMKNIVLAAFSGTTETNVANHSKVLFIHGTKGNEVLSKRAAAMMKQYYPQTKVVCFKGDMHCYKALYEPKKWIETVENFLKIGE